METLTKNIEGVTNSISTPILHTSEFYNSQELSMRYKKSIRQIQKRMKELKSTNLISKFFKQGNTWYVHHSLIKYFNQKVNYRNNDEFLYTINPLEITDYKVLKFLIDNITQLERYDIPYVIEIGEDETCYHIHFISKRLKEDSYRLIKNTFTPFNLNVQRIAEKKAVLKYLRKSGRLKTTKYNKSIKPNDIWNPLQLKTDI